METVQNSLTNLLDDDNDYKILRYSKSSEKDI